MKRKKEKGSETVLSVSLAVQVTVLSTRRGLSANHLTCRPERARGIIADQLHNAVLLLIKRRQWIH